MTHDTGTTQTRHSASPERRLETSRPGEPHIPVRASSCAKWLLIATIALVLCNIIGQVSRYQFGHPNLRGFVGLFDLNVESNIPSFFSSILLVSATGLLVLIGALERRRAARFGKHWHALAIVFAYLTLDEAAQLHEKVGFNVAEFIDTRGFPSFYVWILPFSILVLVLGVAFLPFVRALPTATRRMVIAAGAIYVGAALGLEVVDALYTRAHGYDNLGHTMLYTVEEAGEMGGIILFIYALLSYLQRTEPSVTLGFVGRPAPAQ